MNMMLGIALLVMGVHISSLCIDTGYYAMSGVFVIFATIGVSIIARNGTAICADVRKRWHRN